MKTGARLGGLIAMAVMWGATACDDGGTLVCPGGATLCGAQCSNVKGDPDNCGVCGKVCVHGQICDLGVCTSAGFDAGLPAEAASALTDAASREAGDSAQ